MARPSTGSEVSILNEQTLVDCAARETPSIASVQVTKSSNVHIGPKIISVNQTVENKELIKGQLFGLELVSVKTAKRLRCSVAVFLCWTFLVATGLAFYLIYFALYTPKQRLDIDLPLRKYLWNVLKSTTKAERLLCSAALAALLVCISLIVYYTAFYKQHTDNVIDVAPHEWRITREMWLAKNVRNDLTTEQYNPLKLVIIQHTVSPECPVFVRCAAELRNIQNYYLNDLGFDDIPYNFLIGNDGRVYEGRGWNIQGAHTRGYNRCSVGIGFIGDYREELPVFTHVTPAQLNRTMLLLQEGIDKGYLDPNYFVVGAKDVSDTVSPGSHLYGVIQEWSHYDKDHQFRGKTCDEIYGRA